MNAIQQISLKLQMGIEPGVATSPEQLREMWQRKLRERELTARKELIDQGILLPGKQHQGRSSIG